MGALVQQRQGMDTALCKGREKQIVFAMLWAGVKDSAPPEEVDSATRRRHAGTGRNTSS